MVQHSRPSPHNLGPSGAMPGQHVRSVSSQGTQTAASSAPVQRGLPGNFPRGRRAYAAIDVFTCGDVLDSEAAISYLAMQFRCRKRSVTKVNRGNSDDLVSNPAIGKERFSARDRSVSVGYPTPNIRPIED